MFFLRTAWEHPKIKLGAAFDRTVGRPFEAIWRKLGLPVPNVPALQWTEANFKVLDELNRKRDELIQGWVAKWNLDYEWVRIVGIEELATMQVPKLRPGNFVQLPQASCGTAPHWEWWRGESLPDFRKRRRQHCNREMDKYIRAVERARKPPKGVTARHYRWAVERVCLKWTWDQIAKSVYNTDDREAFTVAAVSKAVLPVLRELCIRTAN